MVLSKEKTREKTNFKKLINEWNEKVWQKKTDLYGSPPGKGDTPLPVLEGNTPANRDEAWRLEGIYEVNCVPYHLLRLSRRLRFGIHLFVCRLVEVDFGHGRLNRAQRIPRGAYVDFVYGRGRKRLAFLDDSGVKWVGLKGGGVLV